MEDTIGPAPWTRRLSPDELHYTRDARLDSAHGEGDIHQRFHPRAGKGWLVLMLTIFVLSALLVAWWSSMRP